MERTSIAEVATWVSGRMLQASDLVGPDVVIDSRLVTPGAVFVALPGERTDGHDHVVAARAAGAGVALVTREVPGGGPQVVVADTQTALSDLARHVVAQSVASGLTVVAITGSSGKTSTKDLVAQVLSDAGPTVAPPGSFNNEIGAPLTAARVDVTTRFLVAEMGARGVGHVAWLCTITPPHIGVVLNVGSAHLGEFGSVEAIAQAKGEIVAGLDADGWAVLNADDDRVAARASGTRGRLAFFSVEGDPARLGRAAALRVWADDLVADDQQRYSFTLNAAGHVAGSAPVRLGVLGVHQVANALAAAAVALAAGLDLAAVAASLSAATARSRWRMEFAERADGLGVLNDAYNANPDSMAAALRALAGLRRPGGRLVAALGDMLELGPDAAAAHRAVGALAAELGIDELAAIGGFAPDLVAGFETGGGVARSFARVIDLSEHVRATVRSSDVVLVKASRGLALEVVAQDVLAGHGEGVSG